MLRPHPDKGRTKKLSCWQRRIVFIPARNRRNQAEFLTPSQKLKPLPTDTWQYLVERPHPWRRQLYIKGRKLLASTVWQDTIAPTILGKLQRQVLNAVS
ncbi:hypothetical protein [[Phormidium] sp. ETS-05]|uniref:hypothetical protein n=1 Tax=[Phormidium] sp. ETS-05 TaxID=222819 RepID=UPI0018EEE517|nr:hypothetical protein [[Phormidium] sp. ETS-05]